MAKRTISTQLKIEGETQYRQAIKNCNESLKVMRSEMELLRSKYKENANGIDALKAKSELLARAQEEQIKKAEQTKRALEEAQKAQGDFAKEADGLRDAIKENSKALDQMQKSAGNSAKQQQELKAKAEELNRKLKEAEANEQRATKAVNEWTRANNYAQRDLNNLDAEIGKNKKYLDEAQNSTDKVAKSIDQYGKEVRKTKEEVKDAGEESQKFGEVSSRAINALAASLAASKINEPINKIRDTLIECTKSAVQYEKGMAEVFTLLPGQSEDTYEKLRDDMMRFSQDMNILTTDGIPALYSAISAGVDQENVFEFLETAQKAAVGGVTDLETSVDGLTSIVNAYGEANINAQESADLMFTAVKLGKTNFQELSANLSNVIPTAVAAGVGFDNITAALAAMTAQGIPTSRATTQLRQMLVELSTTTSKAGMTFEAITGQTFKEFIESGNNVQGALKRIETHAKETGVGVNQMFSSVEAANAALSLTGQGTESFTAALEEMTRSAGAADRAYQTMAETTDYAEKRVVVAFENVKTAAGNALLPTLQGLSNAGAEILSGAEEFIDANPEVVQTIAMLTAGVTVLTAAITAATVAKIAFDFAMGNKAILIASGILALASAFAVLEAGTENNIAKANELNSKIGESKKEYEAEAEAIQADAQSTMNMVGVLEELTEKENKTAAEKETLLSLVDDLNEAVPELNLAYDEQTDSLNMTTEAIKELALAEADREKQVALSDRLKELYIQQAEAEKQLKEAEEELAEAQKAGADQYDEHNSRLHQNKEAVKRLQETLDDLEEEIADVSEKYDDMTAAEKDAASEGKNQVDLSKQQEAAMGELTAQTKQLIAGEDLLTQAYKEQKESGELSLDTILSLIDAGEINALTIDEETGAVKFNTAAYIESRKGKIDEQIASLESQRISNNSKLKLIEEGKAAILTAQGYSDLEKAKKGFELDNASISAQINKLNALKNSFDGTGNSAQRNARKTSSASRVTSQSVKTQAEKDLETFKRLKAELDHEKNMGQIEDEAYYKALAQNRDRYLTSKDNLDTYRSITESIHQYDQKVLENQLQDYEEHLKNMSDVASKALDEIKTNYDSVLQKQSDMEEKLSGFGQLYDEEDGKLKINDLQKQIDALDAYEKNLTELRDRGVSEGLLNEILGMGVEEATKYTGKLLQMGDGQWEEYNKKWEEKQNRAKEIAETFFKNEIETLENEYNQRLSDALNELKNTSFESGQDTAQGLIDGLTSKEGAIYKKAKTIADNIAATLEAAYESKGDKKKKDGSHAGGIDYVPYDGYIAELHRGERVLTAAEVQDYIYAMQPASMSIPAQMSQERQTEAVVNAISTLTSGLPQQNDVGMDRPATIVLQLGDGTEIARYLLPNLREAADQSPRVKGDDFT